MAVQIRKASRKKAKMRMAFEGPAGSGKTTSSLLVAKGLCGDWEKVVVIDTENRSSDLYSHLGDFSVIEMDAPFAPERFIEAIKAAEKAGFEVIIIDSASAEWIGKGGILDIHSNMTGNSFTNWSKLTPRHQAFIDAILQSPAHIICNLRTKTEYVLVEKNGKQVPEKVGMKAETRDNLDYEMTVVFTLDIKNNATTSKDRTNLFFNKPQFVPSEKTGEIIAAWCEQGEEIPNYSKPENGDPSLVKAYNHKTLGTVNKPLISNAQLTKLIERIDKGESDAYDKAKEVFSFESAQVSLIEQHIQTT